jgi:hypothetical protein
MIGEDAAVYLSGDGPRAAAGVGLTMSGMSDSREPEINPTRPMVGSYYCG